MNVRLLAPMLKRVDYAIEELEPFLGFDRFDHYPELAEQYLSIKKFNLVLHPLSHGHAKEWPVERFLALINLLPPERYDILVTGSVKEGDALREGLLAHCQNRIHDLTGQLTVSELMGLISQADGLVAASTGPLHIAAAAGIHTLGLYVQQWLLRPGRYGPIGRHASVMVNDEHCPSCLADKECDCINLITPERVVDRISGWSKIDH